MTHQRPAERNRKSLCDTVLLISADDLFARGVAHGLTLHQELVPRFEHARTLSDGLACAARTPHDAILIDLECAVIDAAREGLEHLARGGRSVVAAAGTLATIQSSWDAVRSHAKSIILKDSFVPWMLLPTLYHAAQHRRMMRAVARNLSDLERSQARFYNLVANNADAIVVVDQQRRVRFANPSAERLLDCSKEALLGSPFGVALDKTDIKELEIGGSDPRTVEIHVTHSVWDGEPADIATLRDITEHKKTAEALRLAKQAAEKANASKSRFLANMSHELRTPLNCIMGFSEVMSIDALGLGVPDKYREYVDIIRSSAGHLLELINDLLDLSKAEQGMLEVRAETFDLTELAGATMQLVSSQAAARNIHLGFRSAPGAIRLHADERMIRQVLLNLLSNAIKFTPPNGSVTVAVDRLSDGRTRILVRDTGVGIPRDQIQRAFAAFVQIDNAYSRVEHQGTGLGLALTRKLVELHQGTITLDSEPDVGTTVRVLLPASRAGKRQPAATRTMPMRSQPARSA